MKHTKDANRLIISLSMRVQSRTAQWSWKEKDLELFLRPMKEKKFQISSLIIGKILLYFFLPMYRSWLFELLGKWTICSRLVGFSHFWLMGRWEIHVGFVTIRDDHLMDKRDSIIDQCWWHCWLLPSLSHFKLLILG